MGRRGVPSPRDGSLRAVLPLLSPLALPWLPAFISRGSLAGRARLCHTGLAAHGPWFSSASRVPPQPHTHRDPHCSPKPPQTNDPAPFHPWGQGSCDRAQPELTR